METIKREQVVGIFLAPSVSNVLRWNRIKTYLLPYITFGFNAGACLLKTGISTLLLGKLLNK